MTRIAIKSQGFSVGLVTGWVAISIDGKPNETGITALLRAAGTNASSAASAAAVLDGMKAMLPGGVRLIACQPAGLNLAAKFVPIFVMYRGPAESITLDGLEALSVQQMAMTSYIVGPIKHRQVNMKPGRVIWWSYHQSLAGADGVPHDSYINQYALLRDGNEYVAVFATLKAATAVEQRQFGAMLSSLTFFPAGTTTS